MNKYRQGDVDFIQIESLPKDLEKSSSNVILQEGSGGNPHSFEGGEFYPQLKGDTLGYLKANNTKLLHSEHGEILRGDGLKEGVIEDGIYQISRQVEETHDGMKPVID